MTVREFASENRLKVKNNGAEDLVLGKYGELAEMNDGGFLRLRLLAVPRSANMTGALRNRRKKGRGGRSETEVEG